MAGSLFDDPVERVEPDSASSDSPLADRMRPEALDEVVGQPRVVGPDGFLRRAIDEDRVPSLIFWGPPGSGKTTLARIVARRTASHFQPFSAVVSGIKEVKRVMDDAAALYAELRAVTRALSCARRRRPRRVAPTGCTPRADPLRLRA